MYKIRFSILGGIILLIFFYGCDVPNMQEDIKLSNDSTILAGRGEVCKNYYIDMECSEGLECIEVGKDPNPVGYCYPPDYPINEENIGYHENEDYLKNINKK